MGQVYLFSDPHEGHRNIGKFRDIPEEFIEMAEGDTTLANTLWLEHYWPCRKGDVIHCLGDSIFTSEYLRRVALRPGRKFLKGGNHDDLSIEEYLSVFESVRGCEKKYGVWLTHIPVHTDELRGKFNVHGHTHYHEIDDYRYINVSCDNLFRNTGNPFITLPDLRKVIEKRKEVRKVVW